MSIKGPGSPSGQVNSAITDSLAVTGANVLASAPTVALSMFYQAAGQAYSLTMQNAASNQHNLNALNPTIVANALKKLSTS
ncbi:hypothetical protein GCM10007301_32850 [Azorhizobium oxalatiphilum]|uniref:RebB like protein n=1 Tax=Azorhizobium oxalatiphilum TaxID=980631 RepID=A0A917C3J5_9HYPH|nr:RebB family R body protein [Azorhizobium oxalatiphilum]GGF70528.1 hypothetical protein GCM10007301_32850 [Azorhizobium oxalatiphilum]